MNNDVLFQNPLVVTAPGDKGHIFSAPGAETLQGLGEREAVGKALFVKTGYFLDLIVHAFEVDGLDINSKLLAGSHVLVELYRADFDYLPAEMDGELVEYGGLGAHCLIPLQIHHHIVHSINSFI